MRDQSYQKKGTPDLTKRYILIVISVIVLLSILITASSYWFARTLLMQQDLTSFDLLIEHVSETTQGQTELNWPVTLTAIAKRLSEEERIVRITVYDLSQSELWSSSGNWSLTALERKLVDGIESPGSISSVVNDDIRGLVTNINLGNLRSLLLSNNHSFVTLSLIRDGNNRLVGFTKTLRDYSYVIETTALAAVLSFAALLISCLLVFLISFRLFHRGTDIVKGEETVLNKQVLQLSDLLDENKQLQRTMKTANSRAVEMNERFLRRVGADLHDGPAQAIGYAVMRLSQVGNKLASEELGQEFHTVKQALEESLEEIRDISSGLVMPELEKMTLEEAVHKVIERHQIKTNTKVKELYFNLPDDIELPIKICAYRFAQEGLNNAHKHGRAKSCRFTAQHVSDVLHLSLKDDGIGFRKSELSTDGGHLGLMGLKDRIESLGGKLAINSELGVGTAIKVSIQMSDKGQ